MSFLGDLLAGPVHGESQVTWTGGDSVRRVERRRRVDWFINGAPASEGEAQAFVSARDVEAREFLGLG